METVHLVSRLAAGTQERGHLGRPSDGLIDPRDGRRVGNEVWNLQLDIRVGADPVEE